MIHNNTNLTDKQNLANIIMPTTTPMTMPQEQHTYTTNDGDFLRFLQEKKRKKEYKNTPVTMYCLAAGNFICRRLTKLNL